MRALANFTTIRLLANIALERQKKSLHVAASTLMICLSGTKPMSDPRLQRHGDTEATVTSALTRTPLVIANKQRAPVAVLSPTKRTAVIECFNNNGLHKRRGYWWGTLEGKHISGVTVADLARDGIFSVVINLRHGSARLTERGQWFARTLIEAANEALAGR